MFKPEIEGVVMYIVDRDTKLKSQEVPIEDVIYNQHDIEFEFEDDSCLPYSDYLFYCDEYETVVKVKGAKYGEEE